jgi:uncharacterized surface protein with fasciclin (FAS1) repeats
MMKSLWILGTAALALGACSSGGGEGNGSTAASNQAAPAASTVKAGTQGTIAQALGSTQGLSSFGGAVRGAAIEATLSGAAPYTVFAPNDEAFGKLGADAEALMKPEGKGRLTALLTGHIVPGVVTAKDLEAAISKGGGKAEIATVGGTTLTASRDGDALVVGDSKGGRARVLQSDVMGSNGVVHVVDSVLKGG